MPDLIGQPIAYTDDVIDSRYRLVIAAAKHTRQLMEGHAPVQDWPYHKATTIALAEVLSKKVEIMTGTPAVVAERKHRDALRAARKHQEESAPISRGYARESQEAIRADVSVYQEDPAFSGDGESHDEEAEI